MKDTIRIANCSGFYGDKLSAAREMVEGGPIDVLTGDYLAELTMSILYGQKMKAPESGYVGTFLKQMREVLTPCKERGIKIVSNAGGLNPKGMAAEVETIATELGIDVNVAYIDGDDLMPRLDELRGAGETLTNIESGVALADNGYRTLTANAYLGAWGIAEALSQGADIVICPRVTDAAVVIGPAAWKFGWARNDYDALAGALAAGHIIECGAQATGGNYAFFQEVPSFHNVGYPIAEIAADGSFVITKHAGTGGLVSEGTVTAQLLYEISAPAYVNPDVVAHFDTLRITQDGPDRVQVSGCRGSAPPATHKVCVNIGTGFRNEMELLLTGLDIEKKAQVFTDTLFAAVGGREMFDSVHEELIRSDRADPTNNEAAFASLRLVVKGRDRKRVGRFFSAKVVELALANFPGFAARNAPGAGRPNIVHWPALVGSEHLCERVCLGGQMTEVMPTSQMGLPAMPVPQAETTIPPAPNGPMQEIPFGRLFGTRSGDKGGCANLGVWAKTDAAYGFLHHVLTVDLLKELLPDTAAYGIDRYDLPNIRALNFYIHGILGDGAAASVRLDGQAKTLGEYLRAKMILVPQSLIQEAEAQ
ncbi:MAG: DUF1446 domain-containing protein [Rhodobacteraceae bacterium]|nr:DUF1446 domain-containing protein [Paracoccaceae bacterium]